MSEDLKYVDDNNNEYVAVASTKLHDGEYAMMCNLNNSDDYFFAKIDGLKENSELEIIEDDDLIRELLETVKVD